MKLGKRPARAGAVKFRFSKYANLSVLPTPPPEFGHDNLVAGPWGTLGNDQYGDCVWAGAAHETMLWTSEAACVASFTDASVLSDYAAATGFNPTDPSTDQGTDVQAAADYRKKVGLLDASGNRHKIGAYLALEKGNLNELLTAAYVFGAVGIGIQFPDSAMDQFNAGQPWSVVEGAQIQGGHYIPLLARRGGLSVLLTWGAEQLATDEFLATYNDEAIVYLSPEMLVAGKTLEGFDMQQLNADLAAL